MFNRILVPTDGSEGMARVIETASELAGVHDAAIHFVYAAHTASFSGLPMETSWERVGSMLHDEGNAALDAAESRASVPRTETEIVEGTPSREIVAYADEADCDLVVMGTHGRGGLDRLLLGSVAERVVRSADVPVLTVRVGDVDSAPDRSGDGDGPIAADPSVTEALE